MFPRILFFACISALVACQSGSVEQSPKPGSSPISKAALGQNIVLVSSATSLSDDDRQRIRQAEARAFTAPLGQKVTWNNQDDSNAGTLTPVSDYFNATGAYCRIFQQMTSVNGVESDSSAKACQQPDGSWKSTK